jgi:tetratricopeptide (TPR) repeat protein
MGGKRARAREFFYLCIAGLMFISFWSCATLEDTRIKIKGKVEAYQSLHRGKDLLAQGDYDGAFTENLKILSLALHRPPEDEALFNMGLILAHPENSKKDYGKSLFFFKKLIADFPKSAWIDRAKIWSGILQENEKSNQTIETIRQMNEKLKQVDRKIEEREEARESLVNSQKLLAQGNYEGALKENQRVLSLYGQHILGHEALFNMGLIHAHPGNPKRDNGKAIFFFNKLTKDFPQSPFADQARIWLGMLLENQRLNQTVEKLQEVIEESKRVDIEIEKRKKEKGK